MLFCPRHGELELPVGNRDSAMSSDNRWEFNKENNTQRWRGQGKIGIIREMPGSHGGGCLGTSFGLQTETSR